jgi:hypothetical protein
MINWWDNLFFTPQSTVTISLLRICVGLLIVIESVQWMTIYRKFLLPTGFFSYQAFKQSSAKIRFSLLSYLPANNSSVYLLIAIQCFSAVLLLIGFMPQVAACICFLTTISVHNRNPYVFDSGDVMRRYFCLFLIFAPSGYALYRIDESNPLNSELTGWPWTLVLIRIFVANIYLKNVYFKLTGKSWRNGTATKKILTAKTYNRFALPNCLKKEWFFKFSNYATLAIEFCLAILIWIDDLRLAVVLLGIIFHVTLWIFLRIGLFQATMLSGLLCFIERKEYVALFTWMSMHA